jgi:hypothetical protein
MLDVDFKATEACCKDKRINQAAITRKYDLKKPTLNRFIKGKLDGKSGCGAYGKCEAALMSEGLLVLKKPITPERDEIIKTLNTLKTKVQ